jgi:hypothetical protein
LGKHDGKEQHLITKALPAIWGIIFGNILNWAEKAKQSNFE